MSFRLEWKKAAAWVGVAAISASLLAGCASNAGGQSHQVVVETAAAGELMKSKTVVGRVMGDNETVVMGKVGGRVKEVRADVGQEVQAGQTLVVLDDRDFRIAVAQQEAALKGVRVRLGNGEEAGSAALNLDNAKKNLERNQALFAAGAIPQAQLDASQLAYQQAKADYDQAGASAEQLNAAVAKARLDLENAVITAPISGRIAVKNVHPGEVIASNTSLLTVVSSDPMVEASVPEESINQIQVGQTLQVRVEQVSSTPIACQVVAVSPIANATSKEYPVKLRLPGGNQAWKSGMYAEIVLPDATPHPLIAKEALVKRGEAFWVMTAENGVTKAKAVVTGQSDGSRVEVISGLNIGDKVVVVGQDLLKDGDPLTILHEKEAAQ